MNCLLVYNGPKRALFHQCYKISQTASLFFFFLSLWFLHLWQLVRSLKLMTFSSTALTSELFVCRNQVIRTQKYCTCCQDPENELICELICAAMC